MNDLINIEKVKQGNPEAFRIFFDFFYPKLMALACRFVEQHTAEDLVQEVFAAYWEQKHTIDAQNIQSYLFKWLQNKCLNFLKHQMVVEEYEARVRMAEARINYLNNSMDFNEVLNQVFTHDIQEIINNSINKLPPKCAEAFRLCYFNDMSHKKIAEQMNISHRTVEGYVQQAIRFLKIDLHDVLFLYFIFFML
ncbi:MAG: RNA polymerase sigma-70 factor [Tannerellaceae bacterium]|jgi:RNA polymerase sigma-70 factor (ECF subfamily)|nr:RNA polymerase sigma-70 factor [Tannerellaceae bacterium]